MTSSRRSPAVFLDRDGVLNAARVVDGRPYPPSSLEQLVLLPGVQSACAALKAAGFRLVVVTNQPDIARGLTTPEQVEAIHERLREQLPLDDIVVCAHDDAEGCPCRKPRPGMLLDAARRLHLDLNRSVCVGDRWRDAEAARRAGVTPIHIEYEYAERRPGPDVRRVANLAEAAAWVLEQAALRAVEDHDDASV